jgi:hypothetical protein
MTRNQKALLFSIVQPKVKQLLPLLGQIESNPAKFQKLIEQRIAALTPPGAICACMVTYSLQGMAEATRSATLTSF